MPMDQRGRGGDSLGGSPFTENLKVFLQGGGVASLRVAVLAHNNCVLRTLSDVPLSLDEGTPPGGRGRRNGAEHLRISKQASK